MVCLSQNHCVSFKNDQCATPAGTHLNVDAEESDAEDVHPPMVPNDSNVESEDGESDHTRAEAEVPAAMEPSVRRYPLRHRRPPDRLTT